MTINLEIINSYYLLAKDEINNLNTKTLVPKMLIRRRLTRASKLIIELINEVGFKGGRIMYGSAYGELLATSNILNAILNKTGVSPTDFQNSVYNTAVSYASMLANNKNEIMTISCGDDTSLKLLKLAAIKALDGDEILILASETMNIKNISEINTCVDYLEACVALRVKVTKEEATQNIKEDESLVSKSLSQLIYLAKNLKKNEKNIIKISI